MADLLTCAGADHVIVSLLSSIPTSGTATKLLPLQGALATMGGGAFGKQTFCEAANPSLNILTISSGGSSRALAGGAVLANSIPTRLENSLKILLFHEVFNMEKGMLTLKC